jgi:hypothetical protein
MKRRISFLVVAFLLLQACSHPLEIEGEGDIVNWGKFGSADGTHSCSLDQYKAKDIACTKNFAITNYDVNYHAAPKSGWVFSGWKGICEDFGTATCPLKISADVVPKFWFKTMPATIAVFEQVPVAVGAGPKIPWSAGLAYDEAKGLVYTGKLSVEDSSAGRADTILAINIFTGDRNIVSSDDQALSGQIGNAIAIKYLDEENNRLLGWKYEGSEERLIAVNLETGNRSVVASSAVGTGVDLVAIVDMEVNFNLQKAYFASNELGFNGVAVLDLNTGNRVIISTASGSVGSGPTVVNSIRSMAYDSRRNRLFVMDSDGAGVGRLLVVDADTGARTIFRSEVGDGSLSYDVHRDRIYINRDQSSPVEYIDMKTAYYDNIDGSRLRNYAIEKMVFSDNGMSTFVFDENLSALLKHHIDSGYYEVISR